MEKLINQSKKVLISSVTLLTIFSCYPVTQSSAVSNEPQTTLTTPDRHYVNSEVQLVKLTDLISGLHMKKLKILGIIADEAEAGQLNEGHSGNKVNMKKVEFIGKNLIAITFDSKFETVDVNDIAFIQDVETLTMNKAAVGINNEGHTVLLFEPASPINQDSITMNNKISAKVIKTNSTDVNGYTLKKDANRKLKDVTPELNEIPNLLTVSKGGLADYSTIQGAIDAIPANNTEKVEIYIHDGIYKELVNIPKSKPFISLRGESASETVITYDNYSGKQKPTGGTYGTTGSASVYVYGDDFTAENITFENSFDEKSVDVKDKQAVAVYTRGERQSFKNTRFIGNQDTLYTNGGTQYFYQSYIEGDVDFIFGGARAVFEDCDIYSLDRGSSTNNGYISAASTLITEPYGYLFLNSRLLSNAPDGTVYLGRPWHPSGNPDAIASVVFKNSYLGPHIHPQGWTDMSGFSHTDARFYEYKNFGPGAAINDTRRQLTDEEAEQYTIENVLKGWNPKK